MGSDGKGSGRGAGGRYIPASQVQGARDSGERVRVKGGEGQFSEQNITAGIRAAVANYEGLGRDGQTLLADPDIGVSNMGFTPGAQVYPTARRAIEAALRARDRLAQRAGETAGRREGQRGEVAAAIKARKAALGDNPSPAEVEAVNRLIAGGSAPTTRAAAAAGAIPFSNSIVLAPVRGVRGTGFQVGFLGPRGKSGAARMQFGSVGNRTTQRSIGRSNFLALASFGAGPAGRR